MQHRRAPVAAVVLLLAQVLLTVGGCASHRPPPVPPEVDLAHVHFSDPVAGEGDPAPDFTLPRADGRGSVALSSLAGRHVVLMFGSYT